MYNKYRLRIIPYKLICTEEDLRRLDFPYEISKGLIVDGGSTIPILILTTTIYSSTKRGGVREIEEIFEKIRYYQYKYRLGDYRWVMKADKIPTKTRYIIGPRILQTSARNIGSSMNFYEIKVSLAYKQFTD